MSEPDWIPISGALVEDFVPTPVDGKWLQGGPGGTMIWADPTFPTAPTPPGLVTPDADWLLLGTAVGFQNSWANYPAPYGPGRFRKLASGLVVMEGLIQSGAVGSTAFTLPVGYRPMASAGGGYRDHIFMSAVGGTPTGESVRIDNNGNFRPQSAAAASWLALNGICFYAG